MNNPADTLAALAPCPFCGEVPTLDMIQADPIQGKKWGGVVCCVRCPEVRTGYDPVECWRDEAIAAWNRRASLKGEAGKWYCPVCDLVLLPRAVTFEETHDERVGGCGNRVTPITTPSPAPQGGGEAQVLRLTARQARVAEFALRRFANDARLGADDAAQKAGADKYPKGAAARFMQDADDAEAILAALGTPPAQQPGEVVTDEMVEAAAEAIHAMQRKDGTVNDWNWADLSERYKDEYRRMARAALAAAPGGEGEATQPERDGRGNG